jgi:hypothetical protein
MRTVERTGAPTESEHLFCYSIVRVVADPIRDEAINIGVAVVGAEAPGARLKIGLNAAARARVRTIRASFDFQPLERSLHDLKPVLGANPHPSPPEVARPPATPAVLERLAHRLNNQLQLSVPRHYVARNLDDATQQLFQFASHSAHGRRHGV